MPPRWRTNPLALAVLCCLFERPMHPYEMAQTMRTRAKHESIRLNYGSLYSVVESMEKRGLVEAVATTQEGRRPQRTVYGITEAGKVEMTEWLADLVAVPTKEYLQFEAALSLIHGLPPDEAVELLRQRADTLDLRLDQLEAAAATAEKRGIPRLFMIEDEYVRALLRTELEFIRLLVSEIESGEMPGIDEWRSWYAPTPGDE
ncbi:MAG TPA: PadR family transcriptional regulator [Acidimicrobiales bacterium]|jgi:DNA-binding PadR family transcriptional regulator